MPRNMITKVRGPRISVVVVERRMGLVRVVTLINISEVQNMVLINISEVQNMALINISEVQNMVFFIVLLRQ